MITLEDKLFLRSKDESYQILKKNKDCENVYWFPIAFFEGPAYSMF